MADLEFLLPCKSNPKILLEIKPKGGFMLVAWDFLWFEFIFPMGRELHVHWFGFIFPVGRELHVLGNHFSSFGAPLGVVQFTLHNT